MKAEFKKTKTSDGMPLTIGKMYEVLEIKLGGSCKDIKEIKIKNDFEQEDWYKANKFKLFAEAAAYLKEPTTAGAGQSAAQSATLEGAQIIREVDAAAGSRARESLEIGKMIAAGLADGIGLHYGA